MHAFAIVRYVLIGSLLFFTIVSLGLSASIISSLSTTDLSDVFAQLDVAVSVITLVVVTPPLIIDCFRKNAFTSMVAVELSYTFVLSIFWVAAAGDTTAELFTCIVDPGFYVPYVEQQCFKGQGLIGMVFLGWFVVLAWHITLIVYAVIAHSRGNTKVWTSSVTGTNFTAYYSQAKMVGMQDPYAQQAMGLMDKQSMPQQQYPGHMQGYPPTGYPPAGYNSNPPAGYNSTPPQQQNPFQQQQNPFQRQGMPQV